MTRVAVIGGGIAGLTAAHHLRAGGCDAIVLEKTHRAGGLIETERAEGFVFEHGPDGFLASRANVLEEIERLELGHEIVSGGPAPRRAFVASAKGLVALPAGLFRFERRALATMLASPLLSWGAKLRLLSEPLVRRSATSDEEDVEAFFSRRLGPEVARCIVDPMFRGIYGAPTSVLGIRSAMPKLTEMEARFGSIGLALLLARRTPSGPGLVTLRRGMSTLVDRIASLLGSSLIEDAEVTRIRHVGRRFRLDGGFGVLDADGIVLACPAHVASRLVERLDPELGAELGSIPFSRADVVGLAYGARTVPTHVDGTGFVVGPDAQLDALMACTWASSKWPHRAPDGHVLLRCVSQSPHADDAELVELVRSDLRRAMGIEAAPDHVRIRRHPRALPAYRPGHRALVASIRKRASALGNIQLAGNAYDGIGVPDCIASGRRAGDQLRSALGRSSPEPAQSSSSSTRIA